jgi:hypothetical protein
VNGNSERAVMRMRAAVQCLTKSRIEALMRIEVLYFEGCPNYGPAVDRLKTVLLRAQLPAEVYEIQVKDALAANALKFIGSPTIRVNGIDIEPASRVVTETGFACRCYPGGLPSEEMIEAALKEAREQLKHA